MQIICTTPTSNYLYHPPCINMGGGVSMFIYSRINYQDRNDINIDIEYVDNLAIEVPKE